MARLSWISSVALLAVLVGGCALEDPVISDDTTMVYSPVSKNIEAGSTSVDKPNALVLTGSLSARIAIAAGADTSDAVAKPEVGDNALEPAREQEMQANLKANPPKPFDITRKMNVFSSKVQYVEFSASNYRLTTRQIPLPPELVDVADDDLKSRINQPDPCTIRWHW